PPGPLVGLAQPRPGPDRDLRDHHRRSDGQRGQRPDPQPLRHRGHGVRRHDRHRGADDRGSLPHRATDPARRARDRDRQRDRQPHLLGHRQARDRRPRRWQRRDRLERPEMAPPGALRPDRRRGGLNVDRKPQALARLCPARAVHRLLGRQLPRLRGGAGRGLTGAAGPRRGCARVARMPWIPELFSAPVLESWLEKRQQERVADVPYFDGLLTGELDALVGSFAGEPELYHPVRGRIKGRQAFETYVADTRAWIAERRITIEDVERVVTEQHGFEEVLLHLDGPGGQVELPVALVADHRSGGRLDELRVYYSSWSLNGRHAIRPPVLQHEPELGASDVVGEYQRALATGDVDAVLAAFEPDGYAREPAGGEHVHRG